MRAPIACLVVSLAACAATPPPPAGPVVERVTQDVAVCGALGGVSRDVRDLRAGDDVAFQRRLCAPLDAKRTVVRCALADVGRGTVVRVTGERCALVRIDAAMRVQPGDAWSLARAPIGARATP